MRRIVVSGASRGLGLEFCKRYLEGGDGVVALARNPSAPALLDLKGRHPTMLEIVSLDVTDAAAVERFGEQIAPLHVDILINNAGQIGPETYKGEDGQNLSSLSLDVVRNLFDVNAIAPLAITRALLPSLRLAVNAKTVVMGTTVGIASQTFGDYYAYRMSKAAVNIAFATLGKDLATEGIIASIVCPGWVRTDMGGENAAMSVEDSVSMMLETIDSLSLEKSGQFVDWLGNALDF